MKKTWTYVALAAVLGGTTAVAQEKAPEKSEVTPEGLLLKPAGTRRMTPMKVQLVLSKYKGEAKVASLPYTMPCNADDRQPNHLRMGIDVPVLLAQKDGPPAYQYKSVGTNIDCRAGAMEDGRFRVELTVEHSSIYTPSEDQGRTATSGTPLFRTFRSGFVPVLRDGQSMQYTVATDPTSGEVVKIDVTLTALK